MVQRRPCPVCGYLTFSVDDYPGSYEICPICFWEDDMVQNDDPDFAGGANAPSLNEARENYKIWDAIEERFVKNVREPKQEELPEEKLP